MPIHNPNNERIKRQYLTFLKEAKRHSESTVDDVASALAAFEEDTKHRDFRAFRHEQAVAFKRHLAERQSQKTGAKLSKATMHATLAHLRRFFQWLAGQPGYKSKLQYSDAEYFSLSEKETRVATARRPTQFPTIEQVKRVLSCMPTSTDVQRRDRALVAFILLTGARDSAVASMRLKHVDLNARSVWQDAREVQTKFSKSFTTYFFPVGDEVRQIVEEWVQELREAKLWGNDDPLFPATAVAPGPDRHFEVTGLKREHWSSAAPIRGVFRSAFEAAGLPYFNPHSLRNTLVQLGQQRCQTAEAFKAWSQNLGHEEVLTTLYSYGHVAPQRQREIIQDLVNARRTGPQDPEAFAAEVARHLGRWSANG
ncbi:MAG TPA: tyrosine-type recombinase/integrase [Candidatus Binatia bacterium]|nr:tyrosine-type recombinase/integrase [Candidatus Binatia bacterium]